jgi:hypothetical protein
LWVGCDVPPVRRSEGGSKWVEWVEEKLEKRLFRNLIGNGM